MQLSFSPSLPVFITQLAVGKQQHWSWILREPRSRQTDLHPLPDTEKSRAVAWQASQLGSRLRTTLINSKSPPARLHWTICRDSRKTLWSKSQFVSFYRLLQHISSMSEVFLEFHLFLIFLANMDTWAFSSWKLSNRNQWGWRFNKHK